jgi:deoxycytidine triphosphate deaminase
MRMRKKHARQIEQELLDLPGSVLSKGQIRALLRNKPPLIEKLIDLNTQLQPNGIDLTVMQIEKIVSSGALISAIRTESFQRQRNSILTVIRCFCPLDRTKSFLTRLFIYQKIL